MTRRPRPAPPRRRGPRTRCGHRRVARAPCRPVLPPHVPTDVPPRGGGRAGRGGCPGRGHLLAGRGRGRHPLGHVQDTRGRPDKDTQGRRPGRQPREPRRLRLRRRAGRGQGRQAGHGAPGGGHVRHHGPVAPHPARRRLERPADRRRQAQDHGHRAHAHPDRQRHVRQGDRRHRAWPSWPSCSRTPPPRPTRPRRRGWGRRRRWEWPPPSSRWRCSTPPSSTTSSASTLASSPQAAHRWPSTPPRWRPDPSPAARARPERERSRR